MTRVLDRTGHWGTAPAHTWEQQNYGFNGRVFNIAATLHGRPLLHGTPHLLDAGDVLLPRRAPANFACSDPDAVSVTTEERLARTWAHRAAGTSDFHVYEVEPLTEVRLWRYDMEGWRSGAPRLVVEEGRVGAARITRRVDLGENPLTWTRSWARTTVPPHTFAT